MSTPTIKQVRAYTLRGAGADYHDQAAGHGMPEGGRLRLSQLDKPGFGGALNPECALHRPYTH